MDKCTGRKTISTRKPIAGVGLSSYTLEESLDIVVEVKHANK
ncbi:hypothetical protein [Paenibacillus sp. BJ-4]|nr:hypothetical protein [Paenibacillus sp. BJ-4]